MASNTVDPGEWPELVERIRNTTDSSIGSRLADRERRSDNYFADFEFTPQIAQTMTAIAGTVLYAEGQRVGRWIHIFAAVRVTAAGAGNNAIRMYIPEILPAFRPTGGESMLVGNFDVYDASVTTWYNGNAEMDTGSRSIVGRASGNQLGIGAAPAFTLASGDIVRVNVRYPSSQTGLF